MEAGRVLPDGEVMVGTRGRILTACLEAAVAAPSIHNSQPWRFHLRAPGVIDVYADPTRRLAVVDSRGREMTISVGAAILNLRVAILRFGRVPLTKLLPDPTRPNLMATVAVGPPTEPNATVLALAEAITRRHTNRRPFNGVEVPEEVFAELAAAADTEGGRLALAGQVEREWILSMVRSAEVRWRTDPRYRDELVAWTSLTPGRRDGIPRDVIGPWDVMETLPLRDFGFAAPEEPRRVARFEPDPTLVILSTPGDDREQWLRAGQALERLLLTATLRGLSSTPMSQPLEIPEFREQLTDPRDEGYPQVILRLGYGRASACSPRRPLEDMLMERADEPVNPDEVATAGRRSPGAGPG